jgi:hypothetical protein
VEGAFSALSKADLVLLDPDTRSRGNRVKLYSRKSPKYAFVDELKGWLSRGKTRNSLPASAEGGRRH